jgi:hypothetical protein
VGKSITVIERILSSTGEGQLSGTDVHPENILKTYIEAIQNIRIRE